MATTRSLSRVYGSMGVLQEDYEPLSDVAPTSGLETFKKMRLNDPIIGGIIFHIETVLRRVKYQLQGDINKYVKASLDERKILELVWDMPSVLIYGFFCGEKIWKADNMVKLVDIAPRHPLSIEDVDDDYVYQAPEDGEPVDIPRNKVVWFYVMSDCRYEYGISMLRNVYKPYYYKLRVEASEANSVDRDLSGLPVMTSPENFNYAVADPDHPSYDATVKETLDWALGVVTNIRADSQQGVVKPFGWELELLRASGSATKADTSAMIKRYNTEICMGLLETFITAGLGSNLNASEAELHLQTFLTACDSISRVFAKALNEQVIPQICEYNGVDCDCWVEPLPQTNYNLKDLASYVARLVAQEVIEPNPVLEDSLLKIANLPNGT